MIITRLAIHISSVANPTPRTGYSFRARFRMLPLRLTFIVLSIILVAEQQISILQQDLLQRCLVSDYKSTVLIRRPYDEH